ncbi:MAG: HAMP domain-containing protein [Ignavibacteriales bacterium]|nr:HAMP domain-containing protein [Ignavibacteriales bacterium]
MKLILIVSLTVIIIFAVFAYFSIQDQSENLITEVERHANQLSETIRHSTRFDMLANRREHVHNIINRIGEESSITNLRILNKEGEIIYSIHQDEIGEMVDKNAESCYACHAENQPLQKLSIQERTRIFRIDPDSSRTLGIINPIYNEQTCWEADCHAHSEKQTVLGVLDIAVSLSEIDKVADQSSMNMIIYTLFAILLIAIVLRLAVKNLIRKPVQNLVKATNYVAIGNLNHRIASSRRDELGQLANSFDNMTKNLSEMRMQLFQSDKLASLGKLAAGVAHEINNPLTGVLTYSSFLLKRAQDNPEMKADLEVIVRETKRSREIVKGLLDFSRQSTPRRGKVNVNEVIENAITIVSNQLKINHVELKKEMLNTLPEISGDANQVQQVILNLIVNAIDALGNKGGKIEIVTTETRLSPYGVTKIRNATCPKGHDLMDSEHKIDGRPSIKLKAKSGKNEGFIHLDPVYGNHNHHYGIEFNKNEIIKLFCPQCGISLVDENDKGPDCGAPVYNLIIPEQGILKGCTKFGCGWQKWDFVDKSGDRNFVEIKISDNGCGINKDDLDKIFDPFFTTKGQKGTGLGLSVIWGIVDNHKGKISVESVVDKGTTFTINLPE